ncbi:MAG: branched-chain-amino-acid transaminase [Elusimicrobia bacterium CG_4_10_14_3_um_filter_49_12_50_7]|nr:MAG: branched-chain-amino-acid transaminase [Elusimicrobia bacterium CG03_land_8_20_14_0_80_50_18]PIX15239.1 MAG: branched-chain-amino-acid transaminase [Elusimicrobia bacterium CG_4_8_14_3_um_filter_50_9]PIY18144.1 MAG: branched-chain-amino-acid transaminase [Elusimicrobia bacterium CG_4_10_14_3_um_filter_49_12_50_7]
MGLKILLDGQLLEKDNAKISVFDHGLLYGDGIFEGIRAYSGRVFRLKEHIDRLYDSAKVIMLQMPVDKKKMSDDIKAVLRANSLSDAYIRVVVTRGVGDLGLDPRKCPKASYFIIADKISLYPDEFYENGLEIATVSTRRNIPESLNPRVKSLNYLNNIMAKIEGTQRAVPEALMLNAQGYVAECTGDNIFIIRDAVITTPPASAGALLGVTQEAVIELAGKRKIEVRKELFTRYCVFTADECFLTGTAAEVIPVVALDGRKIGSGKPGDITLKLIADYRKLTKSSGEAIGN